MFTPRTNRKWISIPGPIKQNIFKKARAFRRQFPYMRFIRNLRRGYNRRVSLISQQRQYNPRLVKRKYRIGKGRRYQ